MNHTAIRLVRLFVCFVQQFHPVNYLRNVALRQANTEHVFLLDVDFLPMLNIYEYSRHLVDSTATIAGTLGITAHNKLVCAVFVTFLLTFFCADEQ